VPTFPVHQGGRRRHLDAGGLLVDTGGTILGAAYRALRGRSLVRGTVPALAEPGSESLSRSGQAGDQRAAA